MKKFVLLPFALLSFIAFTFGQAKKYVLLEHFTNSKCGICASRNPAFFNTIDDYPNDVHHISIHPSFPYNTCVFYLANTAENTGRTSYYGVAGTPTVYLNGKDVNGGSQLLPLAKLTPQLNQTSPIEVKVAETTGADRVATVTVSSLGAPPAGNYRLVVAVTEKVINQTTPNGESVHHNVFRDMLTDVKGDVFALPAQGQSTTKTFSYSIGAGWKAEQIYVLAFLQNADTKEVVNSGTRFDAGVSGSDEAFENQSFAITPNPTEGNATLDLSGLKTAVEAVEVYSLEGRLMLLKNVFDNPTSLDLDLKSFADGVYLVKIQTAAGALVQKLVKQ